MNTRKYLLGALLFFFAIGFASLGLAQDAPRKEKGASIEGRAGDTNFNLRVQDGEKQQAQQAPQGPEDDRGTPGPQGPAGAPGPQGPTGPSGGSSVSGMDPTIALLVGLGVLAVVIVGIVAASRNRE